MSKLQDEIDYQKALRYLGKVEGRTDLYGRRIEHPSNADLDWANAIVALREKREKNG